MLMFMFVTMGLRVELCKCVVLQMLLLSIVVCGCLTCALTASVNGVFVGNGCCLCGAVVLSELHVKVLCYVGWVSFTSWHVV